MLKKNILIILIFIMLSGLIFGSCTSREVGHINGSFIPRSSDIKSIYSSYWPTLTLSTSSDFIWNLNADEKIRGTYTIQNDVLTLTPDNEITGTMEFKILDSDYIQMVGDYPESITNIINQNAILMKSN